MTADARGDVQPQEAGGGEEDYARPFGTLEGKAELLGFRDPRVVEPPSWETVRPSRLKRLGRWIYSHFYRPWQ